ncbi:MAG: hypothetical protein QW812_02420, partial [Thermoplasmataceae archaeon]
TFYSRKYIDSFDVTVETNYRLNFDADRTCGSIRVYKGNPSTSEEEIYEIYQELLECGLTEAKIIERESRVIEEIMDGRLDVTF